MGNSGSKQNLYEMISEFGEKKRFSLNQLLLWIFIIVIINLILVIIWLFTEHEDNNFSSHFAFASTVTSIILSVLAIFMSVNGEAKTQAIRDRIEQEAKVIIDVTKDFEIQMKDLSEEIGIIRSTTDEIRGAINNNSGEAQVISGTGMINSKSNSSD